jgi:alcohol dehydrogenase (cytochrome c)
MRILRTICALAIGGGVMLLTVATIYGQQASATIPAALEDYQAVTPERLLNPEDGNWLSIRRTYDGWGYSPLDEITPENVSRLRPVWGFATGENRVHEAAPVVNNGIMFVTTPNNQVIALDAKTGDLLWRHRRPRPEGASVPHDTNRGVALYGDYVLWAAGEAVLVALDARSGDAVWETTVADNSAGYYITLAPLVAGGTVMVGSSESVVSLRLSIRTMVRNSGGRIRSRRQVNPAARPGLSATSGRPAVLPYGSPAIMTLRPTSHSGGPVTVAPGWATSGRATTFTCRPLSRSTLPQVRSRDTSNTIPTIPGTGTKSLLQFWSTMSATAVR